jgi:hypothetical protein
MPRIHRYIPLENGQRHNQNHPDGGSDPSDQSPVLSRINQSDPQKGTHYFNRRYQRLQSLQHS